MFAWGKGERGQLGQDIVRNDVHTGFPIRKSVEFSPDNFRPTYYPLGKVKQIGAGQIHCAALDDNNVVYVWGKNVLPPNIIENVHDKDANLDAKLPFPLEGLPPSLKVEQISCGSHHTSVLMEDGSVWGSGISSDTKEMISCAICLVPTGVVELPARYFKAHMDRTTIIGADGRQVLQVHLWEDQELRELALFTPAWIHALLEADENIRIDEVHRSWMHSVAVCSSRSSARC